MESSKCDTCGQPIGGHNHNAVLGFQQAHEVRDMTRTGHILGNAANRSEAPNRKLSVAQSCVLRLCLHLAMLQGAIHHRQVQSFEEAINEFILLPNDMLKLYFLTWNKSVTVDITPHRASAIWSSQVFIMSLSSCGNILRRTWRFLGRL